MFDTINNLSQLLYSYNIHFFADEFQKLKMGAAEATTLAEGILVSLR
jgi:hypothetical protein